MDLFSCCKSDAEACAKAQQVFHVQQSCRASCEIFHITDAHVTCLKRDGGLNEEGGLALVSASPELACTASTQHQ